MNEILKIIEKSLDPKDFPNENFEGDVYFQNKDGLNIDRSIYNKLLNKYNLAFDFEVGDILTIDEDLWIVFVNEIFENNSSSLFRMDRNYYLSTVFVDWGGCCRFGLKKKMVLIK